MSYQSPATTSGGSSNNSQLMQEVRLWTNNSERERVENLSELFAVLSALEALEKAFARDYVRPEDYKVECQKLLDHYKVSLRVSGADVASVEDFCLKHRLSCAAALERIREGRPAVIRDAQADSVKNIASLVELFITLLDQLRLSMRAVDELYPSLTELSNALNRATNLPENSEARVKVKKWLDKLNAMEGASAELTDDETRQMIFDLDTAYQDFSRSLAHS